MAVPFLLKVLTVEVGAEPLWFQEVKALVGSVLCEAMEFGEQWAQQKPEGHRKRSSLAVDDGHFQVS